MAGHRDRAPRRAALVYRRTRVRNSRPGGCGLTVLTEQLAAADVCDLETIGRVTGLPRVVELWFGAAPGRDRIYFLSGGGGAAAWVRNLVEQPAVRVRFGAQWFTGTASLIEGAEDEPMARRLLAAKYRGWHEGQPLSRWAREALPVAVDLTAEDGAR